VADGGQLGSLAARSQKRGWREQIVRFSTRGPEAAAPVAGTQARARRL